MMIWRLQGGLVISECTGEIERENDKLRGWNSVQDIVREPKNFYSGLT